MSKTSAKQRYTAFTEWHNWAKTKYPSFKNATKSVSEIEIKTENNEEVSNEVTFIAFKNTCD